MAESWRLEGVYAEACTCEAACPCIMLSDPTEGSCDALVGWHIERGHFGTISLDGLNVAVGVHTPGNMKEKNWTVALYLDERATEEQRNALTRIFAGQAGGHPSRIAEHVATVAGVSAMPIRFESDGRRGRMEVGRAGAAEWEPIEGQGGGTVTIQGHPLAVSPGNAVVVGRAGRARFRDHGFGFEASGRQAMVAPFQYAGP
jgi:hypothetical protein